MRVAVPTVMTRVGLLARIGALLVEHPSLEVQLLVRDGPVDLVGEAIDVAVRVGDVNAAGLATRLLGRTAPELAVSSGYAAERGVPERPSDLAAHPCLRFLGGGRQTHWTLVDRAGHAQPIALGPGLECDDSRALMEAVRAGLGVGFLTRGEIAQGASRGELVRVLPAFHLPAFAIRAVSLPGRPRLARVARVVTALEETARALG